MTTPERRIITVQPAMMTASGVLPYPFHVTPDGEIGRQDFWQGDPAGVVGISDVPTPGRMTATWAEVVQDPVLAVGAFLVVSNEGGDWSTLRLRIGSVVVRVDGVTTPYGGAELTSIER